MRNRYKRGNKRFANGEENPRRNEFLSILNKIFPGLFKGVNRVRRYWESYARSLKTPIHYDYDDSSRIAYVYIEPPASKPSLYVLYVSLQKWYLTPVKVMPKIRKVRKYHRKYSVPNQDSYIAIVAYRATRNASKVASADGVPIRSPDAVAKDVREHWRNRYRSLIASIKGRRIFGELVFFVAMLQEITRELWGETIEIFPDITVLERYAESGFIVPRDVGPPW